MSSKRSSSVDVCDRCPGSSIPVDLAPVAEENRDAYRFIYIAIRVLANGDEMFASEALWHAIESLDVGDGDRE